ncbi:protein kinase [Frankia sp. CNm7]|uniref:non-specific serine/threonine protein kinase n=1 Tax=Frankia nepalensis TaxID=1836974 RepID=A0A937RJ84_9ACTN|nr:serine/threonine-protein kinase [Frankia nepalensis]MBL7500466.1 protein kinase [Frankia nepalensis]MBL7512818.1 protein kinase [Frankia nepalensis]MBL7522535.1 protein kinase [Frankia nepalensis]MBL7631242.1 protein kinase [Frankia nepalensis]
MPAIDRARVAAALPRYRLGEQLGAGSFGLVVAGHHLDLDRAVAVKVLPIEAPAAGGAALAADFRAEAQILSRLDHPHIVRIYDFVSQDDLCLIVMELLAGGTLSQHRLPTEAACAVGLAMADALAHAHDHGALHRDVKPDNILFTATGQPKLTDFGIGKIFEESSGTTSHLAGTPRYMAPEQIEGRVSRAADQYALGVVLYELLAGRPPFDPALPVPELLRHHREVMPPTPTGVPAPIADAVMTALAKAPADRHPDAAAFGHALAAAAAAAYGPDWLSMTGLIVRPQRPRTDDPAAAPTSGRHVFRPATARPEPAPWTSQPRTDAVTDRYLPPDDPTRAGPRTPAEIAAADPATERPADTGAATGDTRRPAVADRPGDDTHPFADAQVARRWFAPDRPLGRAVLAAAAALVALALAVTGVVLATRDSADGEPIATGGPGPAGPSQSARLGQVVLPTYFTAWALGPRGELYIANSSSPMVLVRAPDGTGTVLAGTGIEGISGDGGPAKEARLSRPAAVGVDSTGNVYILDTGNNRIRRVDPAGTITRFAGGGSGQPDQAGPVPATSVRLDSLSDDIAVDRNGDVYFADPSTVYRVDSAGLLTRVARIGDEPTSAPTPGSEDPDAGLPPLVSGLLGALAVRNGRLYAVDSKTNVVRMLDQGTVTTVAGAGREGISGDVGLATEADLNLSSSGGTIALDDQGNLYIAESSAYRVRRVSPDGFITTVAGNGRSGPSNEGRLAAGQSLYAADKVAVAAGGALYIDGGIDILVVSPEGILTKL